MQAVAQIEPYACALSSLSPISSTSAAGCIKAVPGPFGTSTGPSAAGTLTQAYSESKLHVTALALTLARAWPEVLSNAVDPGWVPTKMGGAGATDDLEMGYLTQTWLAVSNDAAATASGRVLVPPATADASTRSPRPGLPERADGTAGRAHRHRALLGRGFVCCGGASRAALSLGGPLAQARRAASRPALDNSSRQGSAATDKPAGGQTGSMAVGLERPQAIHGC